MNVKQEAMNDKIVNISFNVWANSEEEGATLRKSICEFIDWFGQRGIKVSASKLNEAISKWQSNMLVKNSIIKHFNQ